MMKSAIAMQSHVCEGKRKNQKGQLTLRSSTTRLGSFPFEIRCLRQSTASQEFYSKDTLISCPESPFFGAARRSPAKIFLLFFFHLSSLAHSDSAIVGIALTSTESWAHWFTANWSAPTSNNNDQAENLNSKDYHKLNGIVRVVWCGEGRESLLVSFLRRWMKWDFQIFCFSQHTTQDSSFKKQFMKGRNRPWSSQSGIAQAVEITVKWEVFFGVTFQLSEVLSHSHSELDSRFVCDCVMPWEFPPFPDRAIICEPRSHFRDGNLRRFAIMSRFVTVDDSTINIPKKVKINIRRLDSLSCRTETAHHHVSNRGNPGDISLSSARGPTLCWALLAPHVDASVRSFHQQILRVQFSFHFIIWKTTSNSSVSSRSAISGKSISVFLIRPRSQDMGAGKKEIFNLYCESLSRVWCVFDEVLLHAREPQ